LIKTVTVIPGVISPLVVEYLVYEGSSITSWITVFLITSGIYVVCCTVFLFYGSGEVQPWNNKPENKEQQQQEVIFLFNLMQDNPCQLKIEDNEQQREEMNVFNPNQDKSSQLKTEEK
jgi:hypothetical protein